MMRIHDVTLQAGEGELRAFGTIPEDQDWARGQGVRGSLHPERYAGSWGGAPRWWVDEWPEGSVLRYEQEGNPVVLLPGGGVLFYDDMQDRWLRGWSGQPARQWRHEGERLVLDAAPSWEEMVELRRADVAAASPEELRGAQDALALAEAQAGLAAAGLPVELAWR